MVDTATEAVLLPAWRLAGCSCLRCVRRLDSLGRAGILRRVADLCKRTRHCFRCGAYNGNVR